MANDLNQCNFIGRLGRDPETRYMQSSDPVCNFSIAVGWKSKEKEGVEWVNIVVFGKLAEICAEYLRKGKQVFISGRMRNRKWQDKDGNDRYSTEVVAETMQMLGSAGDGATRESSPPPSAHDTQPPAATTAPPAAGSEDDIPF